MEHRWRVPLGDDLRKADVLGLKFVLNREGLDGSAIMQRPQSPFVLPEEDDLQ